MKKFLKFMGFGFLGLVALMVVAVVAVGGDDSGSGSSSGSGNEVKETAATAKEEEKVAKIGETLKVGDVEFTVAGKESMDTVGDEFLNQTAQGKYLVVDVTVTNKGTEAITTDSDYFTLLADGKEYQADGVASMYANDQTEFFLSQLNPDISLNGKVAFDIPAEMHDKELTLQVQTGFFGTETGKIVLK